MTTSDWIAVVGITTTLLTAIVGGVFMLVFRLFAVLKEIGVRLTNIEVRLTRVEITLAQLQVKVDVLWQHHMSKFNSPNRSEMTIERSE